MNEKLNGKITLAYWEFSIILSLVSVIAFGSFYYFFEKTNVDAQEISKLKDGLESHKLQNADEFNVLIREMDIFNSNQNMICDALKIRCQDINLLSSK